MPLKNEKEECAKPTFRYGETVIFDIWMNENQDTLRKPRAPSVYIYIYIHSILLHISANTSSGCQFIISALTILVSTPGLTTPLAI